MKHYDVTGVINNKLHRAYTESATDVDEHKRPFRFIKYYYSIGGQVAQQLTKQAFDKKLEYLEKNG